MKIIFTNTDVTDKFVKVITDIVAKLADLFCFCITACILCFTHLFCSLLHVSNEIIKKRISGVSNSKIGMQSMNLFEKWHSTSPIPNYLFEKKYLQPIVSFFLVFSLHSFSSKSFPSTTVIVSFIFQNRLTWQ